MSVVVEFEEVGACVKKLTIEVPRPAVEAEAGRVLSEFVRRVDLPGFRKGKVPKELIRRRFREEIDKEVVDRLVPRYWQQAQAEKELEPLLPPRVEDLTLEDGEPMTFVASVETSPSIASLNLDPFDLPEGEAKPTETEIEDILNDIRRQHGTWTTVERPAARGDRVIGTMREILAAEGDDEDEPEERTLDVELESGQVEEQLMLALTGLAAEQSTEYTRRVGDGEDAEEKRLRVEIEEVKEIELPDLDDEFAAKVGEFESVEALRETIAEQLEARKGSDLRRRREHALLEQLRERHPLELPERVVEQEVQNMLREYAENLASRGIDFMQADLDWQHLSEEVKPRAEAQVHARLLLDAIAKEQQVELDEQRFEGFLAALAQQQGQSPLAIRQHLSESGRLEQLRADLLREQTVRSLLGEETPSNGDDEAESES